MIRSMIRILLAGALMAPSLPAASQRVKIPGETPVIVKLLEPASSATHKRGDKLNLEVVSDVIVNGVTVIRAGTRAEGEVENASKRFFAGIGGNIDISVQRTYAVNGAIVPLQFKKGAHDGSSVVSIVLTVVCCICFVFIPGKDVTIAKDTLFNATTVGTIELDLDTPAVPAKT